VDDLDTLLDSWLLALRAERKSPATLTSYGKGVRSFLNWCETQHRPAELDRATVIAFTAGLLDDGLDANTVKSRQGSVRRFSKWLADEGEIPADQLIGVKPPKLDQKIIEPFTDPEIKALLKACTVGDPFMARRDEAIVRVMVECGLRAGEVVALTLDDLDLPGGTAVVRRGKGGRGRVVPIGPQAVRALDRYIRAHTLARQSEQGVRLRRAVFGAGGACRGCWSHWLSSSPTQTHRGA
jgi:integrase/recombinase XerD